MGELKWSRVLFFSLLVAVGVGVGLFVSSLRPGQDENLLVAIGIFLAIIIPLFVGLGMLLLRGTNDRGTRYLSDNIALIQAGHAARALEQANALRQQGDRSAANAIVLAAAYTYQGHGAKAEPFAQEALDLLKSERLDSTTRWLIDLASVGLFNARLVRGHFEAAAGTLHSYEAQAVDQTFIHTLETWACYLDGNEEQARTLLTALPQPDTMRRFISGKYLLLMFLMRHRLLGDPAPAAADFAAEIAEWEAEASRQANDAYGRRLREVLAEVQPDS